MMALQSENYTLEKQLHSYQQALSRLPQKQEEQEERPDRSAERRRSKSQRHSRSSVPHVSAVHLTQ